MSKKPIVVGKLSDAKEQGTSGVVGCAGCASTSGTLVGKTFICNTRGCRYSRKPAVNPWSKGAL